MSQTKLERLANDALEAQLIAQEAAEQAADAKAAFEAELEKEHKLNPDFKAVGHVRVKIVPNRYFDLEAAKAFLTKKDLKECTVPTVDPKLVKAHLTPIQTEQAMKDHAKKFKLGLSVLDE